MSDVSQEQIEDMKRKEEKTEKKMADVMLQNKRMTEPLQRTKEELVELRKQLAHYEKDKASLAVRVLSTLSKRSFVLDIVLCCAVSCCVVSVTIGG